MCMLRILYNLEGYISLENSKTGVSTAKHFASMKKLWAT